MGAFDGYNLYKTRPSTHSPDIVHTDVKWMVVYDNNKGCLNYITGNKRAAVRLFKIKCIENKHPYLYYIDENRGRSLLASHGHGSNYVRINEALT